MAGDYPCHRADVPGRRSTGRSAHDTRLFPAHTEVARLQASLDMAGDAITPRWIERTLPALSGPLDLPDKTAAEWLFDLPYGIANQHMAHGATRMGVPVGFWRSVGCSHNAFFSECFIEEIAEQSRQDPFEFRKKLLKDAPRYPAVLNLAAEKAGWGSPLPTGRAWGMALHESFGSIVAQQMESSVIYALSAALYGKVDIREGVVQQTNFPTSPATLMQDALRVETWLVPSHRPPAGVGEPGFSAGTSAWQCALCAHRPAGSRPAISGLRGPLDLDFQKRLRQQKSVL